MSNKKINIEKYFAFITVLSIYLSYMPKGLYGNNLIYAIGEIHSYDHAVFNSNVFMADGAVSPRWMLDAVFAFFMKLNGGSWQGAAVAHLYLGIVVLCIASLMIGYRISECHGHLLAVLFAFFVATCAENQAGGFSLREMSSIGMGMGKAFVILAAAFAIGKNKRFDLSWLFVAAAAVMHIHEGVYGFAAVWILSFFEYLRSGFSRIFLKKNWSILISITVILASVIPNMLTDRLNISKEEFVYIYAAYRHPHHLVPSAWDRNSIVLSFAVILFPFLLSIAEDIAQETEMKELLINTAEKMVFVFAWAAVLGIMFVGIEKLNIVSVTTMFCPKFFKYVGFIALISYLKIISSFYMAKKPMAAALTAAFALTAPHMGFKAAVLLFVPLLAYTYITMKYDKRQEYEKDPIFNVICLLMIKAAVIVYSEITAALLLITGILFLAAASGIIFENYKKSIFRPVMLFLAASLFLCGGGYGDFYEISNGRLKIKNTTDFLLDACGYDIYELADRFQEKTDEKAQYLADPDAESSSGWFQIIAERNCYVLYKVIPSSKAMVKEWYDRYQNAKDLFHKSTDEIIGIMNDAGIQYLLVDVSHYPNFDNNENFEVFTECSNDTYRVYKLGKEE